MFIDDETAGIRAGANEKTKHPLVDAGDAYSRV